MRPKDQALIARGSAKLAELRKSLGPVGPEQQATPARRRHRRTTPETRARRSKVGKRRLPDLSYAKNDTWSLERLFRDGDRLYIAQARQLMTSRPDGGEHVKRKARIMIELEAALGGSERKPREKLIKAATAFLEAADAYKRFVFDPQDQAWPEVERNLVRSFNVGHMGATHLLPELKLRASRPPGRVRIGLQRFLDDVHGHEQGFTDEREARIVAAACGIRDAGTPKVAHPSK